MSGASYCDIEVSKHSCGKTLKEKTKEKFPNQKAASRHERTYSESAEHKRSSFPVEESSAKDQTASLWACLSFAAWLPYPTKMIANLLPNVKISPLVTCMHGKPQSSWINPFSEQISCPSLLRVRQSKRKISGVISEVVTVED